MGAFTIRHPRRPFAEAHWALLVLLLSLFVYSFYERACVKGPRYPEVILFTITCCIALWSNHLRVGHIHNIGNIVNLVVGALYDLLLFLLMLFLLTIPMTTVDCYTPMARVSQLFVLAGPVQAEINKRFVQQKTLNGVGADLHMEFTGRTKGVGFVTSEGTIIFASEDPAAAVILQPVIVDKKLTWKCLGTPTKYIPRMCHQ